jgi:hypothetical protein
MVISSNWRGEEASTPSPFRKKKKIGEEVSCCSHNVSLRVVWNCVHWCEEGGDGLQEAIRGVVRKGGD